MSVTPRAPFGLESGRPWMRSPALPLALVLAVGAAACGGSSGGGGQSGNIGEESPKPGGGTFFVDENQSGGGSRLHLAEVRWGRLVDVHEIDANGERVAQPVFTDFVIEPTTPASGASYQIDRNPVTQRERLTIQARKTGVTDTSAFDDLLTAASNVLPVVDPKSDTGVSAPPFSPVPRNAALVLRFDDCLLDNAQAQVLLKENVLVFTGYTPTVPYETRIIFDPNHGAVVGGAFHSTRVLVDMTVSLTEQGALPYVVPVNAVGMPASVASSPQPNISLRLPSQTDAGSGQFSLLTNVSSIPLSTTDNDPIDLNVPTQDVVRAFRSANESDDALAGSQNGFLIDGDRPRVIGGWPLTVDNSIDDPAGVPGLDFLVDITFPTVCQNTPVLGDVITVGSQFLEVRGTAPIQGGAVLSLPVRSLEPVGDADDLIGNATYELPFDPAIVVDRACWVTFVPPPDVFPGTGVHISSQVILRFTEPMDPSTLSPFEDFMVVLGAGTGGSSARTDNTIVGQLIPGQDLDLFTLDPLALLPHANGATENMHVELGDARDLAGNALLNEFPPVDFSLAANDDDESNGSIVLRFNATDEVRLDNKVDLRGQFFYDEERGVVFPRQVAVSGWPIDRSNPVPNASLTPPLGHPALAPGVFTPLNPLGAKLQMVWRYCDAGWNVRDETKYNLDVVGLNWTPVSGVQSDFFEAFEIRLGHSRFLPDEAPPTAPPVLVNSGLAGSPNNFNDNYLADGIGPKIVHNRSLGYAINPAERFLSSSQTLMVPYPLNRTVATDVTYTWRDTSILTLGADGDSRQPGIPLAIEGPIIPPPNYAFPTGVGVEPLAGTIAGPRAVPTFGLPLLIEYRCYPSDRGVGLNRFDVIMNPFAAPLPAFRSYTAGGINTAGATVLIDPDLADVPAGGFNPISTPPNKPTNTDADSIFYQGQLDTIIRVSRIHTIWLDVGVAVSPTWQLPIFDPPSQPTGTSVSLDYRAATGFTQGGSLAQFDASLMDAYGNLPASLQSPNFVGGSSWSNNINVGNGARHLQVRMTFVNNIQTCLLYTSPSPRDS